MFTEIVFHEADIVSLDSNKKFLLSFPENKNSLFFTPLLAYLNTNRSSYSQINTRLDEIVIEHELMSYGFNSKSFRLSTIALLTEPDNRVFAYKLSFEIVLSEINTDLMRRKDYFFNTEDGFIKARMINCIIRTRGLTFELSQDDEE